MKESARSSAVLDDTATLSGMEHEFGTASPKAYAPNLQYLPFKNLVADYFQRGRRRTPDQEIRYLVAKLLSCGGREDSGTSDVDAIEGMTTDNSGIYDQGREGYHRAAIAELRPREPPRFKRSVLVAQQEWEGYVVEIEKSFISARLIDLTAGSRYESEEATIPLDEITDSDKEKMTIGSIFRWVVGYEISSSGDKKQVSQIVFRDLPRLTKDDFERGKKWAREIKSILSK